MTQKEMPMKSAAFLSMSLLVLAVAGSAGHALALAPAKATKATASTTTDVTNLEPLSQATIDAYTTDATPGFPKPQSKVYQFSLKGKWGVKLDVNQPETAPAGTNDIDAGAFYKLTPSLRVGGTLGFGEKTSTLQPQVSQLQTDKTHPRVRVETTFKF